MLHQEADRKIALFNGPLPPSHLLTASSSHCDPVVHKIHQTPDSNQASEIKPCIHLHLAHTKQSARKSDEGQAAAVTQVMRINADVFNCAPTCLKNTRERTTCVRLMGARLLHSCKQVIQNCKNHPLYNFEMLPYRGATPEYQALRVLDMSQGECNDWRQRGSHECDASSVGHVTGKIE